MPMPRSKVLAKFSYPLTVEVRVAKFEPLSSNWILDLSRLRRGRHQIEIGSAPGGCCSAMVYAIVRSGVVVNLKVEEGMALEEAVIQSAAARAKPIALTGLAAMLGAAFILDDPIFNGLAISLIFGILVSTVLTLVVIPILYFVAYRHRLGAITGPTGHDTAATPVPQP